MVKTAKGGVAADRSDAKRRPGKSRGRKPVEASGEAGEARASHGSVQSLLMGLRILEVLAMSGRERGITELALELGTTKWRIFRHLHSLRDEGYVVQDAKSGKFLVGRRTFLMYRSLMSRFSIANEARSEMAELRKQLAHTVVLTAPVDDSSVVVVDTLEGLQALQLSFKVGATFDLHSSAHGKSALAFGLPHWREKALARELQAFTEYTLTDRVQLTEALEQIRMQGWAAAAEENYRGLSALAAPIFSEGDEFMGSIGIIGSVDLLPHTPKQDDVDAIVAAARRISMKLGWKNG